THKEEKIVKGKSLEQNNAEQSAERKAEPSSLDKIRTDLELAEALLARDNIDLSANLAYMQAKRDFESLYPNGLQQTNYTTELTWGRNQHDLDDSVNFYLQNISEKHRDQDFQVDFIAKVENTETGAHRCNNPFSLDKNLIFRRSYPQNWGLPTAKHYRKARK
ncbi:MAG: hypothetical protein LUE87_03885, partial [Lachnospiraceae bacterium]|nr:hypothetical protein [Lachnospiraceae bacterium]